MCSSAKPSVHFGVANWVPLSVKTDFGDPCCSIYSCNFFNVMYVVARFNAYNFTNLLKLSIMTMMYLTQDVDVTKGP